MNVSSKKNSSRPALALCAFMALMLMAILLWSLITTDAVSHNRNHDRALQHGPSFHDTALLLAGMDMPAQSPLWPLTREKKYRTYKQHLDQCWDQVQRPNGDGITAWKKMHLRSPAHPTLLYPFSGPDLLNAILFFPEAEDYILFGLEPPGAIPDPRDNNADEIIAGLNELRDVLNTLIWVNFFKTNNMKQDIGTGEFDSLVSAMMWSIARTGGRLSSVRLIGLSPGGSVADRSPNNNENAAVPGAELIFRGPDGARKRVRYFQVDVSDRALRQNQAFMAYLDRAGRFHTMIKSASYLMHFEGRFDIIRSIILDRSDLVMQDDSGIPYRLLRGESWRVSHYASTTGLSRNFRGCTRMT